jgi:ABC-type oligopeptide transport system substrate-binding subunit
LVRHAKLQEIDWIVISDRNTALAQLQAKALDVTDADI